MKLILTRIACLLLVGLTLWAASPPAPGPDLPLAASTARMLSVLLAMAMPQTTLDGGSFSGITIAEPTAEQEQAVTSANCDTLCPTIWAVAGVSEPYELAANSSQIQVGDACRCLSGPGPKLRLDGSEQ